MKSKRFLNPNTRSRDCPNLKNTIYNVSDELSTKQQKVFNLTITKQ